jgi:hypothetical protein
MHPAIASAFQHYEAAAGAGAVLELKLRLLAGRERALQEFGSGDKLEAIESAIIEYFREHLSEEDCSWLRQSRHLRNKVLHGDLQKARETLHAMGAPRVSGGVRQVALGDDATGESILASILHVMENAPGSYSYVADLPATSGRDLFGWLLELAAAGDLARAFGVFRRAMTIVDRLIEFAPNAQVVAPSGGSQPR